jgi:hypothetical protein
MKRLSLAKSILAVNGAALMAAAPAMVVQTTGIPGSPGATTTIDGKQLPPPVPKFGGVIKEKASESKPWWARCLSLASCTLARASR